MQLPWIDIVLHFKTTLEQIVVCLQISPPKSPRRPQLVASADFCGVNLFLMADFSYHVMSLRVDLGGEVHCWLLGWVNQIHHATGLIYFFLKFSFSFFFSKLIHFKKSNRAEGFVINNDSEFILSALNPLLRSYSELFLFVVLLVIIPLKT